MNLESKLIIDGKAIGSISTGDLELTKHIGTAKDSDIEYRLTLSVGMCMQVENTITGKKFMLGWEELIDLAKLAGIDEADTSNG